MSPARSALLGLAAGLAALGLAWSMAGEVRMRALRFSHELPVWTPLPVPAGATPASLRADGRRLFLDSCAHCHAADAHGDEGPDLHGIWVSDRRIATVVRHGIPDEMPAFAKKLSGEQIAELIAYVRSLD